MQRYYSIFAGLLMLGAAHARSLPPPVDAPAGTASAQNIIPSSHTTQKPNARDFDRVPLSFEPNQGQTDFRVRFLTHTRESTLLFTPAEAVFSMVTQPLQKSAGAALPGQNPRKISAQISHTTLRMQMVGADPKANALWQQPLPGKINYFLGEDPKNWHTGIPTFGRVGFRSIYPGVDLLYYGNQRHLEYDFLVAPHADPKRILLHFAGAQGVHVNGAGDLLVRTRGQELRWRKPAVYQQDAMGKHAVAARFRLTRLPNGQACVRFALGHYDRARPLVIDPVLFYSTYLSGSSANGGGNGDEANSIAVGADGSAYVTGSANSNDFPVTAGAFQSSNNGRSSGSVNGFVTRFNSTGTGLVYSTFLGGKDPAYGNSIAVDSGGNAYVTGVTFYSSTFPTTPGAFQRVNNSPSNTNAFVTKLDPTGASLLYSTYLGGLGINGDMSTGIAVDSNGNAYVTGVASSANFPTTSGAFQRAKGGDFTPVAFVTEINPSGTGLVYSTFLGGSGGDRAAAIAVDSSGSAYVTGAAGSTDFPTTPGAFQRAKNAAVASNPNAFVTKLNPTGSSLLYSTYLGGSARDSATGIAVDSNGNAYVTGNATSTDFPTTPGAFQRLNRGVFVTKLDPTGSSLLYSTYLGGSGGDSATGIAVDSNGNAYVTGEANSTDFPTTPGAFQRGNQGLPDAFITKLNAAGSALSYSTYLGGSGGDRATGIAIDNAANVYIAGITYSRDFPVTAGAFQATNAAAVNKDASFVTKLSAIPTFPDFNNDGSTDLLIQNASTGVIASWFMQGSTWVGGAYFSLTPPVEYALVGAEDFSGNGGTTLVLQSSITNQVAFWYTAGTNNATIPGGNFLNATPASGWKVVGVGDFNGDGKSDLVFQNQTTNQVAIWFMNGYLYQGGVLLPFTPPVGWQVVGTGDLNADGFTDIVFQNQSTGQIALWFMNGATYAGGTLLPNVPGAGWRVVGVGDYNGDGYADLLFQSQTTNQAMVWYQQSGVFLSASNLSLNPPTGWRIVGPR